VRVLMTGGYGCIGSWATRDLVERGHEVWIFDLKEDTHHLDLVLDPEKKRLVLRSELEECVFPGDKDRA